jgi:hydrogenase 3 maturation protease
VLESLSDKLKGKVLILGVGNPLRGDDGAGPYLLERLRGQVEATLLNCEEVPENYLGKIAENQPDIVLIIDALDFGLSPGAATLLEEDELGGVGRSTHHAPLHLFMRCVKAETGAKIVILGIQPQSLELGSPISDEVKETLGFLQDMITKALSRRGYPI